jgi:hypothetical protein
VKVPEYAGTEVQRNLAKKSRLCHAAARDKKGDKLTELEGDIDKIVAKMWGLTNDELERVQKGLAVLEQRKGEIDTDEDEE